MDKEALKQTVDNLLKEQDALDSKLLDINNAIEALQKICTHIWQEDGHDSHYRYYRCTICNARDKV